MGEDDETRREVVVDPRLAALLRFPADVEKDLVRALADGMGSVSLSAEELEACRRKRIEPDRHPVVAVSDALAMQSTGEGAVRHRSRINIVRLLVSRLASGGISLRRRGNEVAGERSRLLDHGKISLRVRIPRIHLHLRAVIGRDHAVGADRVLCRRQDRHDAIVVGLAARIIDPIERVLVRWTVGVGGTVEIDVHVRHEDERKWTLVVDRHARHRHLVFFGRFDDLAVLDDGFLVLVVIALPMPGHALEDQ